MFSKILWVGFFLFSFDAYSQDFFYFDYDGTVVAEIKEHGGVHSTSFRLFRVSQRSNMLQPTPDGPAYIDVSTHDYYRLTKKQSEGQYLLAKSEGRWGSLQKFTLENGDVFIPGMYMVRVPDTFMYFDQSYNERNYLLEDFKKAEKKVEAGEGTFKGPMWETLTYLLNNEFLAKKVGLITARAHSEKEWNELFDYWIEKGYIQYRISFSNIHGVSSSSYQRFDMEQRPPQLKANLLKEIVEDLKRANPRFLPERVGPSGDSTGKYVTLFMAEDRQDTLKLIYENLSDLIMRRFPVKVVLANTGRESDVRESKIPRLFVISDTGFTRKLTDKELNQEEIGVALTSRKALKRTCAGIFSLTGGIL